MVLIVEVVIKLELFDEFCSLLKKRKKCRQEKKKKKKGKRERGERDRNI